MTSYFSQKEHEDRMKHPWPGLAPYQENDALFFYGRSSESDELFRNVERETLTVVFGASGTGKTSLLNAGLFPKLRQNCFLPISIRLDLSGTTNLVSQVKDLLKKEIAMANLETVFLAESSVPPSEETLWEYLHRIELWDELNQPITPVPVFDQFEEIFTLGAGQPNINAFLVELADLAENYIPQKVQNRLAQTGERLTFPYTKQHYKILLTLREDFVGHLDRLRRQMPSIMHNRFPLSPMQGNQAMEAILGPGKHLVSKQVAQEIVHYVAGADRTSSQSACKENSLEKSCIEPALLSMVCRELNLRRLENGEEQITAHLLFGNRETILENFYHRSLKGMPNNIHVFIEDELLTSSGYRNSVAIDDAQAKYGISPETIDLLVNRRLLRREDRLNVPRVELIHDVLTNVIQYSRDTHHMEDQQREERRREIELRRRLRHTQLLVGTFAVLLIFMICALAFAFHAWRKAERATNGAIEARDKVQKAFAEVSSAMAETTANLGDQAREDKEWGSALIWYEKSLQRRDNLRAGIGAVSVLPEVIPQIALFQGHESCVYSVAFSPDGRLLASASGDQTVRIWDVSSGKTIVVLRGHESDVYSVAFSPDGRLLASASGDQTVRIWDVSSEKTVAILQGKENYVSSIAFSPDGRLLASALGDWTVRIWEVSSEKTVAVLQGHEGPVYSVAFSPDGRLLASGSWDQTVRIWETLSEKNIAVLRGHKDSVHSVAFSPDGKLLASASWDQTVRIWEVLSGKSTAVLQGHEVSVSSVAFSPDGKLLASTSGDRTVRIWEALSGKAVAVLRGHEDSGASVTFSPDGKFLASASWDQTIRIWDVLSKKATTVLQGHESDVTSVAFSPDGKLLASASWDQTVRIWEALSGKTATVLQGHENYVSSIAFSPDGKLLASASGDQTLRIWDVLSEKNVAILQGHEGSVSSVAFSPDGKLLASSSGDQTVRIWDVLTEKNVAVLQGHESPVYSVAFSPDGKLLASASKGRTVRIWDVLSEKNVAVLRGHEGLVYSVAFSPDGRLLASASKDRTVRIWDVLSEKNVAVLRGHEHDVQSVAFSPDGKLLASSSSDWTVRLREIGFENTDELIQKIKLVTTAGLSHTLDQNGAFVPKDKVVFILSQLEAAKNLHLISAFGWEYPSPEFYQNLLMPALINSARDGYTDSVKRIIEAGISLDVIDHDKKTALMYSSASGHHDIVRLLIKHGAHIEARDMYGLTSLIYAVSSGHVDVVHILIEHGADIEAHDNYNSTPLIYAASNGYKEVAELLIQKGAIINYRNSYGLTPLIYAAANGHQKVIELFLEKGADPYISTYDGRTATMYACSQGHLKIYQLITGKENPDAETLKASPSDASIESQCALIEELICEGNLHLSQYNSEEAQKACQEAITLCKAASSTNHPKILQLHMAALTMLYDLSPTLENNQEGLSYWSERLKIQNSLAQSGQIPMEVLASDYGILSFYQTLNHKFTDALESAKKALYFETPHQATRLLIKMNLAHAYLLNDQFEQARAIHEEHMSSPYTFSSGRTWIGEAENDFNTMLKAGIEHPDIWRIKQILGLPLSKGTNSEAAIQTR